MIKATNRMDRVYDYLRPYRAKNATSLKESLQDAAALVCVLLVIGVPFSVTFFLVFPFLFLGFLLFVASVLSWLLYYCRGPDRRDAWKIQDDGWVESYAPGGPILTSWESVRI